MFILGPIYIYMKRSLVIRWLTRLKSRGSDGETMERRRRSEMVRVWAIDHFRPDASGHELRVIDSLWSRDRVTRSIEPRNFLIIEKAGITVSRSPSPPSDALKRSIQFLSSLSSAPIVPSSFVVPSNYGRIAKNVEPIFFRSFFFLGLMQRKRKINRSYY